MKGVGFDRTIERYGPDATATPPGLVRTLHRAAQARAPERSR